jgi:hypothetical protein
MHAYMNMTAPGAGELCMQAAMSVHRSVSEALFHVLFRWVPI